MSTWVRQVEGQNVDLETIAANRNTIKVNDVSNNDAARPAIFAKNSNMGSNARALKIEGMAEILGNIPGFPNGTTIALKVVHSQNPALGTALVVDGVTLLDGKTTVEDEATFNDKVVINDLAANAVALQVTNTNGGANARALKATGMSEVVANVDVDNDTTGLEVTNTSNRAGSRALKVTGKTEMSDDLNVLGSLQVGPAAAVGTIDAGGYPDPEDLNIGAGDSTADVNIGRANQDVNVVNRLNVEGITRCDGSLRVDENQENGNISVGNNLTLNSSPNGATILAGQFAGDRGVMRINTENHQELVIISHATADGMTAATVSVESPFLRVGFDNDDDGRIDANGNGVDAGRELHLGTVEFRTSDVIIGRDGQEVQVNGALAALQELQVGPSDASGEIDSGGSIATPRALKIGSNTVSDNLELGRSGKIVDIKADTRLNGNNLIMNDQADLTTGSGFVYNQTGSGVLGESIDVYIGGSKVGYWDSAGWH